MSFFNKELLKNEIKKRTTTSIDIIFIHLSIPLLLLFVS